MTERVLGRALEALSPVRDRLVVVGGTAHRLFPLHELGRQPSHELLVTEDVDLAAPLELQHGGGSDLADRLMRAGFEEEVRGADEPAYVYRLQGDDGAYLEFIANLAGSGSRRGGRRDSSMRFSGIHAQKLRHVDVLLHAPWQIDTFLDDKGLRLRVVNPLAFLTQKLLTLEHRRPAKQSKDLLYVFDTLAIFAESLHELASRRPDLVPDLSRKSRSLILGAATKTCFVESAVSRGAAAIAAEQRDHPPDSAQIVGACELGLRRARAHVVDDR
jgi:hypothetical protein